MLTSLPPQSKLWVIPLGGLGEIGLNMMAMCYGNDIILIDAGLMFPDEEMLGVDLVIPDISYLKANQAHIRGLILTHGHEDHVGGLPYLLKEINLPLFGTRLTLGLIEGKLEEHGLLESTRFNIIQPRQILDLGNFRIEFIRVCHSIVDGVGLGISTPVGKLIHSGDFKLDHTPIDGKLTDLYKFAEYGERGVLALFSDSTNAERKGYTLSEKEICKTFEDIFRHAPRKIIFSSFASNIHRIQQAVDTACKFGRRVCLLGRSMVDNCRVAMELGYLDIPHDTLIDPREIGDYQPDQLVLITTGSQGEPLSALSRMAMNDHKQIKIEAYDTVIISARVIPGNEKSIARVINHFFRRGAKVIYEEVSEIHVSGHACQEELKLMINLVKPKYFIPIHGEYHQLKHHCELAQKLNIPEDNIILAENGDIIEFEADSGFIAGKIAAGRVFVDGKGVGDIGDVVLRDRQHLGTHGMLIVVIGIDKQSGDIVSGPDIISRGFVHEDDSQALLSDAKQVIIDMLEEMEVEQKSEWAVVKSRIRSVLRKFVSHRIARKPMIMPIIIEL
jgi:ribonuclease J